MKAKLNSDVLFPWPKRHDDRPGFFAVRAREGIQCPAGMAVKLGRFQQEMREEFEVDLKPSRFGRIRIVTDPDLLPEAFRLEVCPDFVQLDYGDLRGLLYGLDTLYALVRHEGDRIIIPASYIEDEPYKPMRGIHLYMPGRDNLDFFKRLLRYLSRLRLNTVFLEIGAGMEFKSHPEINAAWEKFARFAGPYNDTAETRVQRSQGYSKNSVHPELGGGSFLTQGEVKSLVAEAAQYGIEIIPEVPSLSHSYWLCMAHPEIAERSEDPFPDTYCPSNPRSYQILFEVLTEVIEVFHPRRIQIGHDEWYSIGLCPKCRSKSGAEMLLADVKKIAAFLKARKVQVCMWGDKLLNFRGDDGKRYGGIKVERTIPMTGCKEVRPSTYAAMKPFPRDILIGHWYYSLSRTIDRAVIQNGLKFFYGNFDPTIFQNWAGRSAESQCLGGEMSTWVEVSEPVFTATGQLPLMALGANMLWSHRTSQSAPVPANVKLGAIDSGEGEAPVLAVGSPACRALGRVLPALRRYVIGHLLPSECSGARVKPLKLDAFCTLPVKGKLGGLSYNVKNVLLPFKRDGLNNAGVSFQFAQGPKVAIGLGLQSGHRVVIPLRGQVQSLVFLHALHAQQVAFASYANQNLEAHTLAVYRMVYTDNSFVEQPVINGHTIGLFKSAFGVEKRARPFPAFPAWTNDHYTLYAYEWVNPHPDKKIARLVLEAPGAPMGRSKLASTGSRLARGGVLLFAVSKIECRIST